jgi:phosphatidylserine/phosphatidylglycerophosphate/cardiolipin synthase-like enzyme
MNNTYAFFQGDKALLLAGSDYFDYVMSSIREAKKSIFVVMFLTCAVEENGPTLIKDLLDELAYARWRGVDVRVILGTSTSISIEVANSIVYKYLKDNFVPAKYFRDPAETVHSKYILFDAEVTILGSHNWTFNAMTFNHETSIAIHSKDVACRLTNEFERIWRVEEREHGQA